MGGGGLGGLGRGGVLAWGGLWWWRWLGRFRVFERIIRTKSWFLIIDFCLVYFSLLVIFLLNFVGYFYMYNFYYITFVWFLFLVIHNILLWIIVINEIYYHLIIIIICLFISFFTPLLVLKSLYMRVYAIICLVFGLE